MIVTCGMLDEFIENVVAEGPDKVFEKVVRISVTRNVVRELVYRVNFQASTVIDLGEERGQYLLEVGQDCGTDFEDGEIDQSGTERADDLRKKLWDFCNEMGLVTRPGLISM